ncbi:zinc finger CCCH domain-containing protein 3-like isoform X2 [Rutidosis leptorrhynchoides]|uniref:zinc finger CCCH domain-containing protein 3-like isoform X2 n=1 Tax=Rutidosis leptorrhynchoides TaxID=125765 RepID=UPI003A9A0EDA
MPVKNLPDDYIEDGIKSLRIQEDEKHDVTGSTGYPDRPGEPDCVYYLRTGICGYGHNCRYNHPSYNGEDNKKNLNDLPKRVGEPDCVFFLKTGTCKYGSTCKYNHPQDTRGANPIVLNTIGLPMRKGEISCPHYLRTGTCKYGVKCKFNHPQPTVDWSKEAYVGPLSYAHLWSYPSLQTYMPYVLPSSNTAQGWSPYIGNMSQVFSTSGLTSVDHVYPSTPTAQLPKRLGEPECRYFMTTGTCKDGSKCKYNHPMVQSGNLFVRIILGMEFANTGLIVSLITL